MLRSQKGGMAEKRDGEAQGRDDWRRDGWHDARSEGASAKWDLRNEQQREEGRDQREKREEGREQRGMREERRVGP